MATATALKNGGDIFRIAIPMTLFLGVGTGGELTREYFRVRDARLVFGQHRADARTQDVVAVETVADDLDRVKRVLHLTITELSEIFGVSRQAIYNWKAGRHIKAENVAKMQSLAAAADVLASANVAVSPRVLNRVLTGGRTLLETIASGEDGSAAAHQLLDLLRREAEQRKAIDQLVAGRKRPAPDVMDYGSVALVEAG